MPQSLDWARKWVTDSAKVIADNREYLIELDRQIGDGDHGENLDRGFTAVVRGDGLKSAETAQDLLKYVAKTLLSTVGGAAGPLYGTAYLRAASEVSGEELKPEQVGAMLVAATQGVQARGKAVAGEKTMVDAWLPAADAACAAADEGVLAAFEAAAFAAEAGAEATKPLKASKGRASYLGQRSIGHLDPGAVSSALILRSAADAAQEIYGQES